MYCFSNFCRFCMSNTYRLYNYYDLKDNGNISYVKKIKKVLPDIKIDPADTLPHLICTKCINHLNAAYKFQKKCLKFHHILINYCKQLKSGGGGGGGSSSIINVKNNNSEGKKLTEIQNVLPLNNIVKTEKINDVDNEFNEQIKQKNVKEWLKNSFSNNKEIPKNEENLITFEEIDKFCATDCLSFNHFVANIENVDYKSTPAFNSLQNNEGSFENYFSINVSNHELTKKTGEHLCSPPNQTSSSVPTKNDLAGQVLSLPKTPEMESFQELYNFQHSNNVSSRKKMRPRTLNFSESPVACTNSDHLPNDSQKLPEELDNLKPLEIVDENAQNSEVPKNVQIAFKTKSLKKQKQLNSSQNSEDLKHFKTKTKTSHALRTAKSRNKLQTVSKSEPSESHPPLKPLEPSENTLNFENLAQTDLVDHICSVCGRKCATYNGLRVHQRVHPELKKNKKPYASTKSSKLTRRQLVHTGSKPYNCGTCRMSFTRLFSLRKHQEYRVCTRQRGVFVCDVCNMVYETTDLLKQHQNLEHTQLKF